MSHHFLIRRSIDQLNNCKLHRPFVQIYIVELRHATITKDCGLVTFLNRVMTRSSMSLVQRQPGRAVLQISTPNGSISFDDALSYEISTSIIVL